jgi:outer membrane protein insertion porin family
LRGIVLMIKRILLLLVFVGLNFSFSVQIGDVEFQGNSFVLSGDLMEKISSKIGTELVTENIVEDMNAIFQLGYFNDVNVDSKQLADGTVKLIFLLEEHPIIQSIEISGMTVFTQEEILPTLSLKIGEIAKYSKIRNAINSLEQHYHSQGYILMRVLDFSPPTTMDSRLVINIKEGEVEDIFINGNLKTKSFVLLRELSLKPGMPFNVNQLRDDYRSLVNLDYFESINIANPQPGILDPNKVIVEIEVKEKGFGTLNFGGGYGQADGWFGFIDLNMNNVAGEGYLLAIKGQWGVTKTTYEFKYHNPWFLADKTSLTSRMWRTDGLIDEGQGLNALRTGGDVVMGKKLMQNINGSLSFRTDYVEPESPTEDRYLIRSIGTRLSYDTRDFWMNPTEGENLVLGVNTSSKLLGATIEFTKLSLSASKFHPIKQDVILAMRANYDDAYGTIFDTERYFLGGGTTVRGYPDGSPVGKGGRRAMVNLEVRFLMDAFQFVVFYDAGKIGTGNNTSTFEGGELGRRILTGKGVGVRLMTPMGPLRFDYAWGDGHTDGAGIIHFNIGHTF